MGWVIAEILGEGLADGTGEDMARGFVSYLPEK